MTEPVGRLIRARYAFAGSAVALARTLPLGPDEAVLLQGVMRLRGPLGLPQPALLRVTASRMAVLAHHAFRSDLIWDLPRAAVRAVSLRDETIRIDWRAHAGPTHPLELTKWTGRAAIDTPLHDLALVAELLDRWRSA